MANFNLDNYVPVNERLTLFYRDFPSGRIATEILQHELESGFVLIKAAVFRSQEDAEPAATGHAYEQQATSYVNKSSYIENCETSAVGRALALLGYEITKGLASREEMQKVQRHDATAGSGSEGAAADALAARIIKAEQSIVALGGVVTPRAGNESDPSYFRALTEQYKRLKTHSKSEVF